MPMPTFVAAGGQNNTPDTGGTGPVTPSLPVGWAQNDIFLLFIETGNEPVPATTGYTNVGVGTVQMSTGVVTALTVRWKRATASESAPSVSVTGNSTSHIVARLMAIRGCVTTGDPFEAVSTGTDTGTTTAFSIPGGTTLGIDRLVVAALATGTDVTSTAHATGWANASLTSVTERMDNWHITGNGGGFAVATGQKATAGAYNATTGSVTTGNTKAFMSFAMIGAATVPAPPILVMAPMGR